MHKQLELLSGHPMEPDDPRLETLVQLSGKWQEYARQLTNWQGELDRLPEPHRLAVTDSLKHMEECGRQIETALRHQMDTLTWSLKAMHHHATARKAYGGYENQDVIPMYFDERK